MKRIQVSIKPESMARITDVISKCNQDFEDGTVTCADVLDWVIENATFEISKIRHRCLNPYKIKANSRLRYRADVDALIKKLNLIRPLLDEESDTSNGKK